MRDVGLLLGYGSIGRLHARVMRPLVGALVIVDADENARARALADYPGVRIVDRLETLDGADLPWAATLAVIATWGPSHAPLFHALADRRVRRILCEKPLATSVEHADAMVARATRDGMTLASHHYLRYSGFTTALCRLAKEHGIGDPVTIVVDGGAACLVTNGFHWVDFTAQLFGIAPDRVVSTARADWINPRSPSLALYEGTASWSFGGGRTLTLVFSNQSSVYPVTRIYYRHAVATVDYYYNVVLARRDRAAVERSPAVTRTGPTDETLFNGQLPGVLDVDDALRLGLTELQGGKADICPGRDAAAAVHACVGMLVAGREGRTVALPLDPGSAAAREAWPIS